MDTGVVFGKIVNGCKRFCRYSNSVSCNLSGDALKVLKKIPDGSISLILTDPPYHTTKKTEYLRGHLFSAGRGLSCLDRGVRERVEADPQAERFGVLLLLGRHGRETGSRLFFRFQHPFPNRVDEAQRAGIRRMEAKDEKRGAAAVVHTERIIFMEPAVEGNLNRSYFGDYLRAARKELSLSAHILTEMVGAYGKVNHGGAVSNWEAGRNVPSREQYDRICQAFYQCGRQRPMPAYEDIVRPFNVNKNMEFTDVWTFENIRPYKGKHPAEKPVKLLEQAVLATTYTGDIVLDCFAGSGSTAVAALKNDRCSVSIEIDPQWSGQITRLLKALEGLAKKDYPDNYSSPLLESVPGDRA